MPHVDNIPALPFTLDLPDDGSFPLCRDPHTGRTSLRFIQIGERAYPVTNYLCPLCKRGWPAKLGNVAIFQQKEFHVFCLRAQLGERKFSDKVASKDIIKEG